jgi:hypothetical protein
MKLHRAPRAIGGLSCSCLLHAMLSVPHLSYRGVSTEKLIGHQVLLARIRHYLNRQCVNDYLDLGKGFI